MNWIDSCVLSGNTYTYSSVEPKKEKHINKSKHIFLSILLGEEKCICGAACWWRDSFRTVSTRFNFLFFCIFSFWSHFLEWMFICIFTFRVSFNKVLWFLPLTGLVRGQFRLFELNVVLGLHFCIQPHHMICFCRSCFWAI